MPTYDYTCRSCRHTFEVFEGISANPRKACQKCGKRTAHRMIGAGAGLLFKGSGFYITDNRGGDYASKASADKPAEKVTEKSETKTEPKAKPKVEPSAAEKPAKDCAGVSAKPKKGKIA